MPLKIGGKIVDGPKQILLVLPRGDQGDIAFKFIAVLDASDFERLCPPPKPPVSFKVGIGRVENVEDPNYKAADDRQTQLRSDWFFLQSVRPSDIEWTRVKLDDPTTWKEWRPELKEAGFSISEINALFNAFLECNVISDQMIEQARLRFLSGLAAQLLEKPPFQISVPQNTESGELAKDSDSAPQG